MAKQEKLLASLKSLGVEPIEGKSIIVQFAAPNLSAKIANYLIKEEPFHVLQLCQNELLIAPLKWTGSLKNEEPIKVELSTIQKVIVEEKGLNYKISIVCDDGDIDLIAQQKELSGIRTTGSLGAENIWGTKNWHADNLSSTLEELKKLSK